MSHQIFPDMKNFTLLFLFLPILITSACGQTKQQSNDTKPESGIGNVLSKPENPYYSNTDTKKLELSDAEWKKVLPEDVYEISRHAATERAFTGKYWDFTGKGTYYCAACGNKLFRSDAKFASQCGWPSFFEQDSKNSTIEKIDNSLGMERIEVLCARCGGHLGHIFDDGPPPTGKRYCMNSIVLDFIPDNK
jgi:peptide-methionine (R)-S-oxide reductase